MTRRKMTRPRSSWRVVQHGANRVVRHGPRPSRRGETRSIRSAHRPAPWSGSSNALDDAHREQPRDRAERDAPRRGCRCAAVTCPPEMERLGVAPGGRSWAIFSFSNRIARSSEGPAGLAPTESSAAALDEDYAKPFFFADLPTDRSAQPSRGSTGSRRASARR